LALISAMRGGEAHVTAWEVGSNIPAAGSLNLHNGHDGFAGTGSYFGRLQAGYNKLLPSRLLIGLEADVTFPNSISGSHTFVSASNGQARHEEIVQMSGTVRGRIGYAPGGWLLYATGGLAWSFEKFSRTPLAGVPANGTAAAWGASTMRSSCPS